MELVGVVEVHEVDAVCCGGADEGGGFAGVGEDDVRGVNGAWGDGEDLGDFAVGGAVEACAEGCEEAQDVWVCVTFYGWKYKKCK